MKITPLPKSKETVLGDLTPGDVFSNFQEYYMLAYHTILSSQFSDAPDRECAIRLRDGFLDYYPVNMYVTPLKGSFVVDP